MTTTTMMSSAIGPRGSLATKRHGTGVIQPIGNADAQAFLTATQWPNPAAIAAGERWQGARPEACKPAVSGFYQRYPGATVPAGPLQPHVEAFPQGSKAYPGGPVLHDGGGGFLAPTNVLPSISVGRGVARTPLHQLGGFGETTPENIKDQFMSGLMGAFGAATAIAAIAYFGWATGRG